ncbi:MAG: S8 family peptidase [Nostoc sp. DedVER02]|uniref:S8 family peptidase n=1 Tax=unclassified Nostoc TaxID=2593658 RepID=UPI002AD28E05|nr:MULTISPECIES: S8 family serine peptidase [unclassified Nostoc]MDZ7985656.1 S8 family serine peptidase [Nostoc sp. DedVER02]MDZ8111312.1 S8 family serine peptidase [Nostoc sp. DedVER01b]
MSVYIIRPKATSVARSLKLASKKFTPESRPAQVAEVVNFWQENPVHQEIESWLKDAQNSTSQVSKHPDYSGITGASIVEMPDDQAQRMREELPNALILRDQPIELIEPQRNANTKDELSIDELWHLDAIALNIARQNGFTGTGKSITIAVLDTGIDSTHPELQGKVTESYSFNDRSKQIQLTVSQDTDGHGTHVAGLICGQQVGVAPETKLIDGVLIPRGTGNLANFVMWLDWLALRVDVNIANISAGLPAYAHEISDVIDTLLAVGILPVCAVGNDGRNNTRTPANCRSSVSVGAANFNSKIASFSGSGRISVNNHSYDVPYLVAPGQGVYSSVQGGGYEAWDGTSMATPIVSDVAALILEKYSKQIPVLDLIDVLLTSCKDLGHDKERQGKGLIQVTAAL